MGAGLLCDRNRVPGATLTSNTTWAANSPLNSVKTLPLVTAAVSTALGTSAAPVTITGTFDQRYVCVYAGLLTTNLRQASRWRLELFSDSTTMDATTRLFDSRAVDGTDRAVVPNLCDWRSLRWGDSNLFRGDLPAEDFALYPSHIHCIVPLCRPAAFRWSLYGPAYKPDGTEATGYSIGHMWLGDGISLVRHVNSEDGYSPTDDVQRYPGGGASVEPGTGYRKVTIERSVNERDMRDRLFDLAKRVDFSKPVIWLPNIDDLAACFRYGGIFQRRGDHTAKWFAPRHTSTTMQLEEVTT